MFGGVSVGLYIDGKRIYVAELRTQFGRTQVIRSAEADVPASTGNSISDSAPLSQAISEAFKKARIHHKEVFVALPEKDSMIRYFEMPLLPKKEQRNSVRFEAQKYVPFDIKDLYYDFGILIEKPQKKVKVMLLAAKKETAHDAISTVQNAGLKVRSLESASSALVRALYLPSPKDAGEVFAIVDIDRRRFINILIVKNHVLLMARYQALSKSSEIQDQPVSDFKLYVAEIRLSLNYFAKNFKNEKVFRIVLSADLENDFKGWNKLLENELGMTVGTTNPLNYDGSNRTYSSGMMTAIGLGLRGTSDLYSIELNLVPKGTERFAQETLPMSESDERKLLKKAVLIETVAVIAIWMLVYYLFVGKISSDRIAIANKLQAVSAKSALPLDQLGLKEAVLAGKASFLTRLIDKRIYLTTKMNEMARTVPTTIRMTALNYTDSEDKDGVSTTSLRIEGTVLSKLAGVELDVVSRLVAALGEDKEFMQGFDEVKIASIQNLMMKNTPMTKFIIDCSMTKKKQG